MSARATLHDRGGRGTRHRHFPSFDSRRQKQPQPVEIQEPPAPKFHPRTIRFSYYSASSSSLYPAAHPGTNRLAQQNSPTSVALNTEQTNKDNAISTKQQSKREQLTIEARADRREQFAAKAKRVMDKELATVDDEMEPAIQDIFTSVMMIQCQRDFIKKCLQKKRDIFESHRGRLLSPEDLIDDAVSFHNAEAVMDWDLPIIPKKWNRSSVSVQENDLKGPTPTAADVSTLIKEPRPSRNKTEVAGASFSIQLQDVPSSEVRPNNGGEEAFEEEEESLAPYEEFSQLWSAMVEGKTASWSKHKRSDYIGDMEKGDCQAFEQGFFDPEVALPPLSSAPMYSTSEEDGDGKQQSDKYVSFPSAVFTSEPATDGKGKGCIETNPVNSSDVNDKDENSYISSSTAVPSSESCTDSSPDDCSSTATSCYNSCSDVYEEIDDSSGKISSSGGCTGGNSSSSGGIEESGIEYGQPVMGLWDSYWMKPSVSPSQFLWDGLSTASLASSDDNSFDHIINGRLLSFD